MQYLIRIGIIQRSTLYHENFLQQVKIASPLIFISQETDLFFRPFNRYICKEHSIQIFLFFVSRTDLFPFIRMVRMIYFAITSEYILIYTNNPDKRIVSSNKKDGKRSR